VSRSSKYSFPFRFSHQNSVCTSPLSLNCVPHALPSSSLLIQSPAHHSVSSNNEAPQSVTVCRLVFPPLCKAPVPTPATPSACVPPLAPQTWQQTDAE
jgi:hypothetical protein